MLTDRYEGKRYNTPNDLTIDSKGRIYFSDPRYGDRKGMEILDEKGRTIEGVYRIDPDGKVVRIIGRELERPNGVLVSADDKYLFVADNNNNAKGGAASCCASICARMARWTSPARSCCTIGERDAARMG